MPNRNPVVQTKAEDFAVRVAKAYQYLTQSKNEKVSSLQLYRSGTSISANVSEAQYAQSKLDFIAKMHIALKEANESRNWISILFRSGYINYRTYESIRGDAEEIIKLLTAILRTAKGITPKHDASPEEGEFPVVKDDTPIGIDENEPILF